MLAVIKVVTDAYSSSFKVVAEVAADMIDLYLARGWGLKEPKIGC